jgi:DNA-binding MarR family transcriptional regulator
MLRLAYNAVHDQGVEAFDEHGLRPQQFGILLYLEDARSSQQGDAAAALGMLPPNFAVELKPLVEQKLVRRRTASHDARVVILSLTRSGKKLLSAAKDTDRKLERSFDDKIGRKGRRQLLRLLAKLVGLA